MKIASSNIRINDIFKDGSRLDRAIVSVRQMLSLSSLVKACGGEKRNGHSVHQLMYLSLFLIPLGGCRGSILAFFRKRSVDQNKLSPALYRFLRKSTINWRKVYMTINTVMRNHFKKSFALEVREYPRVLIADDTALLKSGKRIEGISNIHDHTDNRYKLGFKMLGMMYFNGFYSHYVDFSLHAEGKWSAKFRRLLGCSTTAGKRSKELMQSKTSTILAMIKRLRHFKVDYFLADSWFCSPKFMGELLLQLPKGCHVLMHAKMNHTQYDYNGSKLNLKDLLQKLSREQKQKRCKEYNTHYFSCKISRDGITYKVYFSRLSKKDKWIAFLSTDCQLSYIKAMRVYALRWKIEIGFRELKQQFNIGKSQANSFAAQVAHITLALSLHSLMSHYLACSNSLTTMGELFREIEEELQSTRLFGEHWLIFKEMILAISEQLGGANRITVEQLLNANAFSLVESMIDEISKWPGRWNSDFFIEAKDLAA
jgi:hypothetical protein